MVDRFGSVHPGVSLKDQKLLTGWGVGSWEGRRGWHLTRADALLPLPCGLDTPETSVEAGGSGRAQGPPSCSDYPTAEELCTEEVILALGFGVTLPHPT